MANEYTVPEFINKLQRISEDLLTNNKPLEIAVIDITPKIAQRIFIDGEKSDGSKIGQYDTKRPFYVNPNFTPAANKSGAGSKFPTEGLKPTKGKHGDHTFKNGRVHKTTYVENYKDFRNRIGRRIDFVNLHLSGDLESDFKSQNPIKVSENEWHVKLKRDLNTKKAKGNEDRFGKTFSLQEKEQQHFIKVFETELKLAFDAR